MKDVEEDLVKYTSMAVLGVSFFVLLIFLNSLSSLLVSDDDDVKQKGSKKTHPSAKKAQRQMEKSSFKGVAIVGASGSGKTSLYYKLLTGEFRDTVSSIEENYTGKQGVAI